MESLLAEFSEIEHYPSTLQVDALRDVAQTLENMAEGCCDDDVYLSSLDPGVGKTKSVVHFIKALLSSLDHKHVAVLICLPRLAEIDRVVVDLELPDHSFAVLTSDSKTSSWSDTPPSEARVLFTTHQMVASRCKGLNFRDVEAFYFQGMPREVRIWDESMLPAEVVAVSTDDLGLLIKPVRRLHPGLAEQIDQLREALKAHEPGSVFNWPDIAQQVGLTVPAVSAMTGKHLSQAEAQVLENILFMSGRLVRIAKQNGRYRTALDFRDMLPKDLAPILVLDASGRVRTTYRYWEQQRGGLKRLKSAPKDYTNLSIRVLDQGGGKDSWRTNGDQLLSEVASMINTKPNEPWLVIHHRDACGGKLPQQLIASIGSDSSRIHFVTWGEHQGTNDYAHIENVILAGTLFLPDGLYQGLAHAASGVPVDRELPDGLTEDIKLGEHGDLILQGLCRASVRGSDGAKCQPCNAYIIASKGSGIRQALPSIFPGCRIHDWKPKHKPLRGKVADAVAHLQLRLDRDPQAVITFAELMEVTRYPNKANFNRTIRRHPSFVSARDGLGLDEVAVGRSRQANALARPFGPIPGASYVVDVFGANI